MADEIQNDAVQTATASTPTAEQSVSVRTPVGFDRVDWLSFGATMLISLVGYLFTLSPNLTLEWSGMLSTSAAYGGIGPPPGYPVWTLYSWCFIKLLPISNIAWRVAVGSAVAAACACGLVSIMVSRSGDLLFGRTTFERNLQPRDFVILRIVASVVAGLVLAFSGTVWDYAVIVEMRALSLLMFVAILCLFFRWSIAVERKWYLASAFFVFGLLLTNSQELITALPGFLAAIMLADVKTGRDVSFFALPVAVISTARNQWSMVADYGGRLNWPLFIAFIAIGIATLVLIAATRALGSEWKCALICAFALLLGMAFYLYVPLASMSTPPVNWAYPRTVEGFWHAISRGQFERASPTHEFGQFLGQTWELAVMTVKQFGGLYLAIGLVPFCLIGRMTNHGRRSLGAFAVIWICVTLLMLIELNPPSDRQAWELVAQYFAASHSISALWLGLGLLIIGAKFAHPREPVTPQPELSDS